MIYGRIKTSAPKTGAAATAPVRPGDRVPFGVVRRPATQADRPIPVAGVGVQPPRHRRAFYGRSFFA